MRDLVNDLSQTEVTNGTEDFREQLRRVHERKKKRWMLDAFFYLMVGVTFMIVGGFRFQAATEVKGMLFGALIIIIGFEITVLTKLAYLHIFQMYSTLCAIKEAHLDILEQTSDVDVAEKARDMFKEVQDHD